VAAVFVDEKATKAAKLITGSKKVGLIAAYGLIIWKSAPILGHWLNVKAAALVAVITQ